ncbi:MAG: transposase family protein [Aquirufa antheringensis]|nr:transposase family protein [Aquirufa antheringensis]
MDFLQDSLYNRSKFRILSVVDNFSKKCLGLFVVKSIKGGDVVGQLNLIKQEEMHVPMRIQCDNGSEFISKEVDK